MFTNPEIPGGYICDPHHRGVTLVDSMNGGCFLVHREALESIEPPWFKFRFDEQGLRTGGEDTYFSEKLNAAGIRTFCDYDIHCGHRSEVDVLDMIQVMAHLKSSAEQPAPTDSEPLPSPESVLPG
jgi:GT2 family glycosyltransferase